MRNLLSLFAHLFGHNSLYNMSYGTPTSYYSSWHAIDKARKRNRRNKSQKRHR